LIYLEHILLTIPGDHLIYHTETLLTSAENVNIVLEENADEAHARMERKELPLIYHRTFAHVLTVKPRRS
jgi:hypothetical protein